MTEALESAEELREVILAQRRELHTLRRETADVALLLDALDALLRLEGAQDPFTSVFGILHPVFRFADALVLLEREPDTPLACIASTAPELVGGEWPADRLFEKVLAGRVTSTMTSTLLASSPVAGAGVVGAGQPALYVPLGMRRRRGMMILLRTEGDDGFDRRDISLAGKFSLLASHALAAMSANRSERERQRLHRLTDELEEARAALTQRANHDDLTGLPNRSYFRERVTEALAAASDRHVALAFIDLDGFKQVNDRYGHETGDQLLSQVAGRILRHIRSTDLLARISGDEFVLLVDPLPSDDAADVVVERILAALRTPFAIEGNRILLSASIGIATHPEHGSGYDELRRAADLAMYSAKSRARGTAARYDLTMGQAVAARAELERVVRRALAEHRFRPVLQPLVGLGTMEVIGFEVLARREDEHGRLHPPSEFIALATELEVLDDITLLLVDQVLAAVPAIDDAFGDHTTFSVNVSAHQATDVRSIGRLVERLRASGSANRFVLEVTEDAYLQAGIFQRDVLPLLRRAGIRVSIDDFGAGYSSLASLLDLDANELKMDRAFVTAVYERPRSQVLLRGLSAAAAQLGITVVAEGIETTEELDYVRSIPSILTAQGYLFARPAPPAELVSSAPEIIRRLRSLHPAAARHPVAGVRS